MQETRIQRVVNAYKTLYSIALRNKNYISTKEIKETCKKYHISRDLLARSIELNYVKRLEMSTYKFILVEIQPFHARKIVEKQNQISRESTKHHKLKDLPEVKLENTDIKESSYVVTKENNDIVISKVKAKPKKVNKSINKPRGEVITIWFWGLFKRTKYIY